MQSLLKDQNDISAIDNIAYRQCNEGIVTTPIKIQNINDAVLAHYKGIHKRISYLSEYGCPYSCKFCAWSEGEGSCQYLPAERVYEDLKVLKECNEVEQVDMADSIFLFPPQRVNKMLELIEILNINWTANARTNVVYSPEFIERLEKSGCIWLYFGFESMDDDVLVYIDKKATSIQNRKVNSAFRNSNISTISSFIIGFPGETPEKFMEGTYEYLINEHFGDYYLYVFEMENENMPIWEEREKYGLELYPQKCTQSEHRGTNWKHFGMDSETANQLRRKTMQDVRKCDSCKAVYRTWQSRYSWPLIPEFSRIQNVEVEILLDRLGFLPVDYSDVSTQRKKRRKLSKS